MRSTAIALDVATERGAPHTPLIVFDMPMTTPSPSQILEQIRSHYLTRLRQAIDDHAAEGILQIVPEAALRDKEGRLLRRGDPPTPVRVDLITLLNEQVRDGLTIESETMPGFDAFSLRWKHELPVKVNPFPWNACGVLLPVAGPELRPVIEWFERWFDAEETKSPGEDGLLGVVHSITKTPAEPGFARLLIDLGSAPVDAFQEMIDSVHAMGVPSVEIGRAG